MVQLPSKSILLVISLALGYALLLAACGGGGSGDDPCNGLSRDVAIYNIEPKFGQSGNTILVTGKNFHPDAVRNRVLFPGVSEPALVEQVSSDNTQLRVTVPDGVKSGYLSAQIWEDESGSCTSEVKGDVIFSTPELIQTILAKTPVGVVMSRQGNFGYIIQSNRTQITPTSLLGQARRLDTAQAGTVVPMTVADRISGEMDFQPDKATKVGLEPRKGLLRQKEEGGHRMLVTNSGDDNLSLFDLDELGQIVFKGWILPPNPTQPAPIDLSAPIGIAADAAGLIYVTNGRSNSVSILDLVNNTFLAPIENVGTYPVDIAINQDNGQLFVINRDSQTLTCLTKTGDTYSPVSTPLPETPVSITLDKAGLAYILTEETGKIVSANFSGCVVTETPISFGHGAVGLDITPDGAFICAVNGEVPTLQCVNILPIGANGEIPAYDQQVDVKMASEGVSSDSPVRDVTFAESDVAGYTNSLGYVNDYATGDVYTLKMSGVNEEMLRENPQDCSDKDNDLLCDEVDNCPDQANTDQKDSDNDKTGDACDSDNDNDTIANERDNCPWLKNSDQKNSDEDQLGDACDLCPTDNPNDSDGDGICQNADNCPDLPNSGQSDCDSDKIGDACDEDNSSCASLDMVNIPAGEFLRGTCNSETSPSCLSNEPGYSSLYNPSEAPLRTISLNEFNIDNYPVTLQYYTICVKAGRCEALPKQSGCYWDESKYANYPVNCLTWAAAKNYCDFAGKRLPSEAEWEKAARGSNGQKYPWGNTEPVACTTASFGSCNEGAVAVGSYEENVSPYGVHDMAGNMNEWTADWWDETYYQDTYGQDDFSPAANPQGPQSEPNGDGAKVIRGGSWKSSSAGYIRSASRNWAKPAGTYLDVGFRCVRDLRK